MSERYSDSSIEMLLDETVGGGVQRRLAIEIKQHRAMVKRLEELALSLEHNYHPDMRKLAAELRNRMRTP